MKKLYLVRHGKAEKGEDFEYGDKARRLTTKGAEKTKKIAERFVEKEANSIDLIITSDAVRAFQTAKIFAKELKYDLDDLIIDSYFYGEDQVFVNMLKTITSISNYNKSVMIVGHEPSLTQLICALMNYKYPPSFGEMEKSGIVKIEFESEWNNFAQPEVKKELTFIEPDDIITPEEIQRSFDICKNADMIISIKKKYMPENSNRVTVKDLIDHLQTFNPDLPITVNTSEIGPVTVRMDLLKEVIRVEDIDFVDDTDCLMFKSLLIG